MDGIALTREQVRQVDVAAGERYRMPSIVLMENAARQLAAQATAMLGGGEADTTMRGAPGFRTARGAGFAGKRALIVCGGGNNGGDGLAAARHLHNAGVRVDIALLKPDEKYDGDAGANLAICRAMGMNLLDASDDAVGVLNGLAGHDLVLDAVLGTGLSSAVRGSAVEVIGWINEQPAPVLAVDIPSGLDCDRGEPLGTAVRASRTVTFVADKVGFEQPGAAEYTGEVVVADIGVPIEAVPGLGGQAGASAGAGREA
jgi:NAD(P)H-hydrate epimerase